MDSRALQLLIDGLRFEFAAPDPNSAEVFVNQMPVFGDLLASHANSAALFRFVADPPTTTVQRLKALATGSLPTFVEFSTNFGAGPVQEDSLPYQWHRANRTVAFTGDHVWAELFPGLLTPLCRPIPSLDVKDLDAVDDGVMRHVLPDMQAGLAQIIIGHLDGLDHAGHTFGLEHPRTVAKMRQLNAYVRSIAQEIDQDSLLLVLGDHGFTRDGGHGGAREEEVSAALFAFTRRLNGLVAHVAQPHASPVVGFSSVRQVDLVPTLALLTGVAVPFPSVGKPIAALLCSRFAGAVDQCEREFLAPATVAVARQVSDYARAYAQVTLGTDQDPRMGAETAELARAITACANLSPGEAPRECLSQLERALDALAAVMRERWTSFDFAQMNIGLALGALAVVAYALLCWHFASSRHSAPEFVVRLFSGALFGLPPFVARSLLVRVPQLAGWSVDFGRVGSLAALALFCAIGSLLALFALFADSWRRYVHLTPPLNGSLWRLMRARVPHVLLWRSLGFGLVGCQAYAQFSNSYILAERRVVLFLLLSGVVASTAYGWQLAVAIGAAARRCTSTGLVPSEFAEAFLTRARREVIGHGVLLVTVLALAERIVVCGAEHMSCDGNGLPPAAYSLPASLVALGALTATVLLAARGRGNSSPLVQALMLAQALLACLTWLAGWAGLSGAITSALARLSALSGLAAVWAIVRHGALVSVQLDRLSAVLYGSHSMMSVFNTTAALLFCICANLASLLLGHRAALPLVLLGVCLYGLAQLARYVQELESVAVFRQLVLPSPLPGRKRLVTLDCMGGASADEVQDSESLAGEAAPLQRTVESATAGALADELVLGGPPATVLLLHAMLASYFFFVLGGRCEFSALRLESAFVLLSRFDSLWLAAPLVVFAVCASYLLVGLSLPLFAFGPLRVPYLRVPALSEDVNLVLDVGRGYTARRVGYAAAIWLALPLSKALCSMIFVRVENRHLMALRIFAPKLAFDCAFVVIAGLSAAAGYGAAVRVQHSLAARLTELGVLGAA